MKKTSAILALFVTTLPTGAMAQDVVVMRRTVAPPNMKDAPSQAGGTWKIGTPVATPGCSSKSPTIAPVSCVASDGRTLPDSSCKESKPSGAGTAENYAACTYKWITGVYGTPTPTCSSQATRTRTVSCQRQDDARTPADASLCDPASPDAKTTDGPVGYYGGCSYTPTYSAYGSCVNGTQTATMTSCRRSDGTDVSTTICTTTDTPQTQTKSCGGPSMCVDPNAGYSITGYANFRQVAPIAGTTTLQKAKEACEAVAGIGFCYINYYTGAPFATQAASGTPYVAYVTDSGSGSYSYVGTLPGRIIYSAGCSKRP